MKRIFAVIKPNRHTFANDFRQWFARTDIFALSLAAQQRQNRIAVVSFGLMSMSADKLIID